ncbi:MAG: hypothetical protein AAGD32_00890 [Planctomycetota bacterium]
MGFCQFTFTDGSGTNRPLRLAEAEAWIGAALATARALQEYDRELLPATLDPEPLARAEHLHEQWSAWFEEAQVLVRLIREKLSPSQCAGLAGFHDLRIQAARAAAIIQVPPREEAVRLMKIRSGEIETIPLDIARERERLAKLRAEQ